MPYLVDTNVVSELRKKSRCDRNVAAWQAGVGLESVFISVVSMMEIHTGILRAKRADEAFASVLAEWYENQVKPAFEGRVLDIDLPVAEVCSHMMNARTRGMADSLIAATAHVYGLTLVTRNTADFSDTGIALLNPWEVPSGH
jgi:toxin FitB